MKIWRLSQRIGPKHLWPYFIDKINEWGKREKRWIGKVLKKLANLIVLKVNNILAWTRGYANIFCVLAFIISR
jgi:hypothetical protein